MIAAYLDISIGHLTLTTRRTLENLQGADNLPALGWPAMTLAAYDYGYFLTVPDLTQEDVRRQMLNMPQDLQGVLQFAYDRSCQLVRFDADGDDYCGLTYYEDLE